MTNINAETEANGAIIDVEEPMPVPYEKLKFTDDFMFCRVLTVHPEICKKLAELFTGRRVRKIDRLAPQLTLQMASSGKGVRFDVWFDGDDAAYDFEMQTSVGRELPKRTRYYQSMLDMQHLSSGHMYRELADSYIVFICMKDPFGAGLCRYTFRNMCNEQPDLPLGDGAEKIFVNAHGIPDEGAKELAPFLEYLKNGKPSDPLTDEIEAAVAEARDDEEGRAIYMTLEERDERMREQGRRQERAIMEAAVAAAKAERDQANVRADQAKAEIENLRRELDKLKAGK